MPRFRYEAVTNTGASVTNTEEADSRADLVAKLKVRGYWPTMIEQSEASTDDSKKNASSSSIDSNTSNPVITAGTLRSQLAQLTVQKVKPAEVEFFTYQMATLVNSHIPLVRSLDITLSQINNVQLQRIIEQIKYDVEHGSTLADALSQHPKQFSDLYVSMIRAGEASGVLGEVMSRLAEFAERQRNLTNEVISALFYPLILMIMSVSAIAVLMVFVVPKFTAMFETMGGNALPGATQVLISIADFTSSYWWVVLGGGVISILLGRQFSKTADGELFFDRLKLRLPIFGNVFSNFAIVRFTRTMATLLENGVVLVPALNVAKDTVGNRIYSDAITKASEQIEGGSTLAHELDGSGVFPDMVVHMISIGEESGSPEQMLGKLSDYYDVEVRKTLERVTGSLGPLVILVMGLVIGFIAVAMILPIFEASSMIGG